MIESDEHVLVAFCNRATAAFFSNRVLLVNQCIPRASRLRMFHALGTTSFCWSLCILSFTQRNFNKLRIQYYCTLLRWFLGGRAHNSWFDVRCVSAMRQSVKSRGRVYGQPWDELLATAVWQWLGHVFRLSDTALVKQALNCLKSTAQLDHGFRRSRTGPGNSGHRPALPYLLQLPLNSSEMAMETEIYLYIREMYKYVLHIYIYLKLCINITF